MADLAEFEFEQLGVDWQDEGEDATNIDIGRHS